LKQAVYHAGVGKMLLCPRLASYLKLSQVNELQGIQPHDRYRDRALWQSCTDDLRSTVGCGACRPWNERRKPLTPCWQMCPKHSMAEPKTVKLRRTSCTMMLKGWGS